MGSRDFERATPNRIGTATTSHAAGMAGPLTFAAAIQIESLPAAAATHMILSLQSATTARQVAGGLSQAGGGFLAQVGATQVYFASGSLPTPLAEWLIFAWTKATGTVTPSGYTLNMKTHTFTGPISAGGTLGNRTAAAATINFGAFGAIDYWDGLIARAMVVEKVLTADEIRQLRFPGAWRQHIQSRDCLYVDAYAKVTTSFMEERSALIDLSSGTPAELVGLSPPGW